MASETVSASITVKAPAEAIFAVLADPAKHAAIDGTGWVRDPLDRQPLTGPDQVFRMDMYHPGHPNGNYEMTNLVLVFDPPHAISRKLTFIGPPKISPDGMGYWLATAQSANACFAYGDIIPATYAGPSSCTTAVSEPPPPIPPPTYVGAVTAYAVGVPGIPLG